jgi:GxxExxY protein
MNNMGGLLFEKESYIIIGTCMTVHKNLGAGFLESIYQEALEKEFEKQGIEYKRQKKINVYYEGEKMKKYFIADFICYDKIVLEIKAASFLHQSTEAQTINYLKSTNYQLGLLVNFGQPSLVWKRFINTI